MWALECLAIREPNWMALEYACMCENDFDSLSRLWNAASTPRLICLRYSCVGLTLYSLDMVTDTSIEPFTHASTLGFWDRFGRCAAAEPSPSIEATMRRMRLSPTPRGWRRSAITWQHMIVELSQSNIANQHSISFLDSALAQHRVRVTFVQTVSITTGSGIERRAAMTSSSKNGNRDSRPVARPSRRLRPWAKYSSSEHKNLSQYWQDRTDCSSTNRGRWCTGRRAPGSATRLKFAQGGDKRSGQGYVPV